MEATGFSPRFEENTIYRLNNELKKTIRSTMAVGSTSLLMMTAVAPIGKNPLHYVYEYFHSYYWILAYFVRYFCILFKNMCN